MMNFYIAFVALMLERFFAYPMVLQMLYRHPVEWIGDFIFWFEEKYNFGTSELGSSEQCKKMGFLMIAILVFACLLISLLLIFLTNLLPFSWFFQGLIAFTLISQKQLGDAVRAVENGLDISLNEAREALSHIVGRDVNNLEEEEISRGAIETLAENASDGFIAPLFYLLIFGLPGIIIYKAINTADSMVGHKNERYIDFGFASAKVDDIVNYIPARLSAILFIISAMIYRKSSNWKEASIAVLNDADKHASPNAGYPEAAMAGALGFSLGGKRKYGGEELDLAQMGNGKRDLTKEDIKIALGFYSFMSGFVLFLTFIGAWFILVF